MQSYLPIEILLRILRDIPVHSILSYYCTCKEATKDCDNENFWRSYVEYNKDIRKLKEEYCNSWPYEKFNMLFIQDSKIIRSICRSGRYPISVKFHHISNYDDINNFLKQEGCLYGNEICIDEDGYVCHLQKEPINITIKGIKCNKIPVDTVVWIKDMRINDIPVLELITDWEDKYSYEKEYDDYYW